MVKRAHHTMPRNRDGVATKTQRRVLIRHRIVQDERQCSPGRSPYVETIDFQGKAIVARSSRGPDHTIIVGGGILCVFDSNPTISNNRIFGNSAELGGGICAYYTSPVIEGNIVELNESLLFSGGGITTVGRSARIACNVIRKNYSWGNGGGIAVYDAQPMLLNNTVMGNDTRLSGDGMFCSYFSRATVTNGIF